jgi:hypothetical protein
MNCIKYSILVLITLLVHLTARGQEPESQDLISATLLENSSMTIIGSSTLHDWEVEATDFSVQFRVPGRWFDSDEDWVGKDIAALNVIVPVDRLDGGKNKMNRDLREALRFKEHPEIQFIWDNISFTGDSDIGKSTDVTGLVTIAGEEREVQFDANLSINEWSQIVATGRVSLNMRDYNIDPPTVLFGVIRTDEEVDLLFELFFGAKGNMGEN